MASCEANSREEAVMPRRKRVMQKMCIKCKDAQGNLVVRGLVYCKICLEALVVQRFKKAIDEAIPSSNASSSVLAVAFSGGLGSTLLLDLVAKILCTGSKRTRRHCWDKVYVIYIDCNRASPYTGRTVELEAIERIVARFPHLALVTVPLENAFFNEEISLKPLAEMQSHLASLPTRSAVKDSLSILTRRLLERTASSLGATHLLLGRTLSSLSSALLTNVCSGRAFSIAEERRSVTNGLISFNPLQEVGSKECAACVWWRGLHTASSPILRFAENGTNASILDLTRAFISGLEKDFPSTVSTIVKTCAKVTPKGSVSASCFFCARPVQAIDGSIVVHHASSVAAYQHSMLPNNTCYACHALFTSANSKTTIPADATLGHLPIWAREATTHT